MLLPVVVEHVVNSALDAMCAYPQHQLLPVERFAIYQALRDAYGTHAPDPLRAKLGVATARYVLPLWQAAMPLHPPGEDQEAFVDGNTMP